MSEGRTKRVEGKFDWLATQATQRRGKSVAHRRTALASASHSVHQAHLASKIWLTNVGHSRRDRLGEFDSYLPIDASGANGDTLCIETNVRPLVTFFWARIWELSYVQHSPESSREKKPKQVMPAEINNALFNTTPSKISLCRGRELSAGLDPPGRAVLINIDHGDYPQPTRPRSTVKMSPSWICDQFRKWSFARHLFGSFCDELHIMMLSSAARRNWSLRHLFAPESSL